jgi:hypothetical protein
VSADLGAARPLGRPQDGADEAAFAVEHHDRLEAVFVIMGVEQAQLLAAVYGVEGVVDVENDPLRHLPEGGAVEVDHGPPHRHQLAHARQVLQPADRRLRTQRAIRWRQFERHLEHRIGAQGIGVVAVLIARRDHQQPEANDVSEAMRDLTGRPRVHHTGGYAIGDAKPLVDLAQNHNAAVR